MIGLRSFSFSLRRLTPLGWTLAAAGTLAAAALHVADRPGPARLVGLITAVAVSLALHVDLPWGGRLTLGHAVVIALVVRAAPGEALLVAVAGVAVVLPWWMDHAEEGPLRVRLGGAAAVALAAVSAVAVRVALDSTPLHDSSWLAVDLRLVIEAAVIGVVFIAVDHVVRRVVSPHPGDDLRHAWPLYVTILCVAALVDVALRRSIATAFIATVPLLVTRYSFQRYTTAQRTYAQTTQALSLLPEVAGLTPLGHAERTAVYAAAVTNEMGLEPERVNRIATAARLHHIGHISLHEPEERAGPPDPSDLAAVSAEILEETGFLGDLAEVVGDAQAGGAPAGTVDAAVVRVCSHLDELMEDSAAVDPFASLVALYPAGHERTVAIALLALQHRRPALVAEARGAASTLARAAAGSGSGGGHGH